MAAPEHLPQHLRHCVDQTVAAEALEGWRPTVDQIAALAALVNGEVSFADYLSEYRHRYAPQPTSDATVVRRAREAPYLIPGTSLLRNEFGAADHKTLADLEFVATAGRLAGWHRRIAHGDVGDEDLDVRLIHRQLFADVYAWAGSYRVTELRLGDDVFARRSSVLRMMRRVEVTARALVADHDDNHDEALACQLARLYANYNYIHPFREGNGRTGTLILHIIATLRGRRLDLGAITREQWYTASRESMPSSRRGQADAGPFVPLIVRALD